jgi:hypothetical protein
VRASGFLGGSVGVSSSDVPGTTTSTESVGPQYMRNYRADGYRYLAPHVSGSVENVEQELLMIRRKKGCCWRNGIGDSIHAQDLGESPNSTGFLFTPVSYELALDMLTSCRLRISRMSWLGRQFEPFGSMEAGRVILE